MKASDDHHNELLTAYFDGELSHAEQVQVEQILFGKPEFRQLLQQWAVLRAELQSLGGKLGTTDQSSFECSNNDLAIDGLAIDGLAIDDASKRENPSDGYTNNSDSHDRTRGCARSSALASAIMDRIAGANREGRVKWQINAGGAKQESVPVSQAPLSQAPLSQAPLSQAPLSQAPLSQATSDGSRGNPSDSPKNLEVPELKSSADDHWLSDYRKVTPRQRMRRWAWQMSAIVTVAGGLFLTVYFNGPPTGFPPQSSHLADHGGARSDSRFAEHGAVRDQGATDKFMAKAADARNRTTGEVGPESVFFHEPAEIPAMAATTAGDSDFSLGGVGITAGYSGFVVFAVGDHERGLEQMQSVLATNNMEPVEILEVDGIQAVVLSGELKTISDLLGDFQAAGDNSVAFMSKVGMPQAADASSNPTAIAAAQDFSANNDRANVADTLQNDRATNVVADDSSDLEVSDTLLAESIVPPTTQVLSEIELRNQVVVLGNSFSTAAPGITLEQFFNQHVPRQRMRIPYQNIADRNHLDAVDRQDIEQNPPAPGSRQEPRRQAADLNMNQERSQLGSSRATNTLPLRQESVSDNHTTGETESPVDNRGVVNNSVVGDEKTLDPSNIVQVVVVLRPKNFDVPQVEQE
jgi:hypothetical protein